MSADTERAWQKVLDAEGFDKTTMVPTATLAHVVFEDDLSRHASLIESVRQQGIRVPLELWEYEGELSVQDGYHRLEVARRLGLAEVPVRIQHAQHNDRTAS